MLPWNVCPFLHVLANAIVSYVAYLGKTFWPVDLAVFYPYDFSLPLWKVLISGIILILITIAVLYYIKKLPFLFVGWFWYLGTLDSCNRTGSGRQSGNGRPLYLSAFYRYCRYAGMGNSAFIPKREIFVKRFYSRLAIAILVILAVLTWHQCGYWKNSITLFSHALRVTKNNYLAHNNLGIALFTEGKFKEAIDHYNEVIMMPNKIMTYNDDYLYSFYGLIYSNRGRAYSELSLYKYAFEDYSKSIRLNPKNAGLFDNRGSTYYKLDQQQCAIEDFNEAIRLKPDVAIYYNDRGNSYNKLGQHQRALDDYTKAISLKPEYADAYNNRGAIYGKFSQYQRAIEDFNKAIYIKPDYADAYNNRGLLILGKATTKTAAMIYKKHVN